MIPPPDWFSRKFTFNDLYIDAYPGLIERLRGTPARLADRLLPLPREVVTRRDGDDWSMQEHAGHLLDLEELGIRRCHAYARGDEILPLADLDNRKTYAADHNARPLADILADFRRERGLFVAHLEGLNEAQVLQSALHPRLQTPMRLLDFAYFVAEHDDHHLAQITVLIRKFAP